MSLYALNSCLPSLLLVTNLFPRHLDSRKTASWIAAWGAPESLQKPMDETLSVARRPPRGSSRGRKSHPKAWSWPTVVDRYKLFSHETAQPPHRAGHCPGHLESVERSGQHGKSGRKKQVLPGSLLLSTQAQRPKRVV